MRTNWEISRWEADKVTSKAQGIHDTSVDKIVRRLEESGEYSQVYKELDYHNPYTREDGEIDVLAEHRNGSWFIFEYKCTNHYKRRNKAIHQLERAERYIAIEEHATRIYKFYVSGGDMDYKLIKINN